MQASDLDKCRKDDQGRAMVTHRPSNGLQCAVIGVDDDCLWVYDANTHDFGTNKQRFSANIGEFDPMPPAKAERETDSLTIQTGDDEPIYVSIDHNGWVTMAYERHPMSFRPEEVPLLRDWLNTHYPAPVAPTGNDRMSAAETEAKYTCPKCGKYCRVCADCQREIDEELRPDPVATPEFPTGTIIIKPINGGYDVIRFGPESSTVQWFDTQQAAIASLSSPAPRRCATLERITKRIADDADHVIEKRWGMGTSIPRYSAIDCFKSALREHLPALVNSDAVRLMRLVEADWQLWKSGGVYKLSRLRSPDISEFTTLTAAIDAAEKIGGA